ncbi:MAG TPA: TolC family protein [Dictyoglomaceae bacterium]|nr:TolC family protein [Dictyoglomaceae bacterium]HOP94757.1 TolC family protein [Dictyoglomaceae bacterium]HPP16024.1 TolC family protein [Dictyoglomaceae bacterium]
MCKRVLGFIFLVLLLFNVSFSQESLTLESLLPLLQKSPLYQIYQAQYESYLQSYYASQAQLEPKLSAQVGYNQGETSITLSGVTSTTESKVGSITFDYSQVLFPWGDVGISLKSSAIDLEQAKNDFRLNYQNLYYQFLQYFYDLYLAQEQLKIYEENYNLAVKQREVGEDQFKKGAINEITLLDYKQQEKLAEISYSSAKNNLEIAYKTLESFLGTKLERIPVKIDIKSEAFSEKPEDLINVLYNGNITIKNAVLDVEKSKLSVEKAKLPSWSVSVGGSYNTGNTSVSFSFNTQNYSLGVGVGQTFGESKKVVYSTQDVWNFKISFSTPILDGGTKNISIKQAELSLEQATLNYEKTKRDVELSFWKTYYSLLQAQETLKQKEMILEQKKANYDAQKIRYELGLITELDLKSYKIDCLQAEYDLKNAVLNFNLQKVQLDILLNR